MSRHPEMQPIVRNLIAGLALFLPLAAPVVMALPDDAGQPMEIAASSSELFLDQGLVVYYGTEEQPASITQGSMQITGVEISIERKDEVLSKVIAKGAPARFQQQLEVGQEPLQASGLTLTFDNTGQTLSIDVEAELLQAGTRTTGHHFDYDLQSRRVKATQEPGGEQIRMVIPPSVKQ
jgi:lipopolysaccharide export system protein LptA